MYTRTPDRQEQLVRLLLLVLGAWLLVVGWFRWLEG
jgi:hypothetical protein